MDQGPAPPNVNPPPRIQQPLFNGSVPAAFIPTPVPSTWTEPAAAGVQLHKLECWVFDKGISPTTTSTHGAFTKEHITDWMRAPTPSLGNNALARPTAGLRLVCREQRDSMKWPFDRAMFEALHEALGLPKSCLYLQTSQSGACGKYIGVPGQPSKMIIPPVFHGYYLNVLTSLCLSSVKQ